MLYATCMSMRNLHGGRLTIFASFLHETPNRAPNECRIDPYDERYRSRSPFARANPIVPQSVLPGRISEVAPVSPSIVYSVLSERADAVMGVYRCKRSNECKSRKCLLLPLSPDDLERGFAELITRPYRTDFRTERDKNPETRWRSGT
jgi:hypothetical protein